VEIFSAPGFLNDRCGAGREEGGVAEVRMQIVVREFRDQVFEVISRKRP
jgi:hypothetical protein